MSLDALKDGLPGYAKDLALNLTVLAGETALSEQQKWGSFLACAHAVGVAEVVRAFEAAASAAGLSDDAKDAAKAAAAIMGMNNVYHRAIHLMTEGRYRGMPARLRMNIIRDPGVGKADFELYELAVSAINGCGACLDAHERALRERHGLPDLAVQAALRIAAVVNAVSRVTAAEAALAR